MSADRDMTRIVRSWLRTDEHESADRVLGNVLVLLDATPQRRSWWPVRRIADMQTFAKYAIAAAVMVAVAIAGYNLLPSNSGVGGGPAASPSPSPSPSAIAVESPAPTIVFPPAGPLTAGRHTLTEDGTVFSIQIPDGWSSSGLGCSGCATADGGWLTRGPEGSGDPQSVWAPIWNVDGVVADPCTRTAGPSGQTATELADAVASLPGTDLVTAPEDVTVGGRPAKHVVIKVRDDIECSPTSFKMWGVGGILRFATALGETNRVWIVDVNGSRFWFEAETYEGAGPELEQEIQDMVDSIQFE